MGHTVPASAGKLLCLLCVLQILPAALGGNPHVYDLNVTTPTIEPFPVLLEYIGANGTPIYMRQVPVVDESVPYYVILSFGIDAHPNGSRADGVFSPFWTDTLDRNSILQFKAKHPNVRVLVSLAGWSIYTEKGDTVRLWWYEPKNETQWINNAVSSLSKMVKTYNLDGFDIDYESFPRQNRFAYCMGTVIKQLKSQGVITIATIAPFSTTAQHYLPLYQEYGSFIDLVNYQFYTDRVPTASRFVSWYNATGNIWGFEKLVASFAIRGPGVSGDNFFVAVNEIQKLLWVEKKLVGPSLLIWCVEDGVKSGFKYEKQAQTFLKGLVNITLTR